MTEEITQLYPDEPGGPAALPEPAGDHAHQHPTLVQVHLLYVDGSEIIYPNVVATSYKTFKNVLWFVVYGEEYSEVVMDIEGVSLIETAVQSCIAFNSKNELKGPSFIGTGQSTVKEPMKLGFRPNGG